MTVNCRYKYRVKDLFVVSTSKSFNKRTKGHTKKVIFYLKRFCFNKAGKEQFCSAYWDSITLQCTSNKSCIDKDLFPDIDKL
jgi:hypothetical protein